MKAPWLLYVGLVLAAIPLRADTIYQATAEGNEIVLQRDAIVVQQDSSFIVYKHFDLKERRVTIVRLNRGSLPMRVQTANAAARAQILAAWKRFGYKITLTDQAGKTIDSLTLIWTFTRRAGAAHCSNRSRPSPASLSKLTTAERMKSTSTRSIACRSRETNSASCCARKRLSWENS